VDLAILCPFSYTATDSGSMCPLSLHDALPICSCTGGCCSFRSRRCRWFSRRWRWSLLRRRGHPLSKRGRRVTPPPEKAPPPSPADRKSTRLNSSHVSISYAVFCLNKKNKYYEK